MNKRKFHPRNAGRTGCRVIGCALLALLLLVAVCGLVVLGALSVAQRASAQTHPQPPHRILILIDQSGSVAREPGAQAAARDATLAVIALGQADWPSGTVRLNAFGATVVPLLPRTTLSDPALNDVVQRVLRQPQSLGATQPDVALMNAAAQASDLSDVVLITDGIPDPVAQTDAVARAAYAKHLQILSAPLQAQGIALHIVLVGDYERSQWAEVWRAVATQGRGVFVEVNLGDDVASITTKLRAAWVAIVPTPLAMPTIQATPTVLPTLTATPTVAPTPTTRPTPLPTQRPTHVPASTAPPQPTATAVVRPAATAQIRSKPTAIPQVEVASQQTPPPLAALLGIAVGLGGVGLVGWGLRSARRKQHPPQLHATPPADEGCLEIYDPQAEADGEDVRRIELRKHVMGEIITLGCGPRCDIALGTAADVIHAAITFTPRGPVIAARESKLQYEGRYAQQHLLFDGDVIFIANERFVICYHNFFRQRAEEA